MSKVVSSEVVTPSSSLPQLLCVFFSILSSQLFDQLKLTVWTEFPGRSTGHSGDLTFTVRSVYFSSLSSLMVELQTQVFKSENMASLSGLEQMFQPPELHSAAYRKATNDVRGAEQKSQ